MGGVFGKISVEVPSYEILVRKAGYELRKYPAVLLVDTPTQAFVAGDNSFRKLAKFIGVFGSPENKESESISMTAPVITTPSESASNDSAFTMGFVLPSKFENVERVPTPTDPSVSIKSANWGTVACATFSGWASESDVKRQEDTLKKLLLQDGYTVAGRTLLARYNPPWTLGPLRKNEVLIPVQSVVSPQAE